MISFRKFLQNSIGVSNNTSAYSDLNNKLDIEISKAVNSTNVEDYDMLVEMADKLSLETVNELKKLNNSVNEGNESATDDSKGINIPKYETNNELKEILRKIATTYGVCAAFLGAKRMNILADILNRYLTVVSNKSEEEKENLKEYYSKVHFLMLLHVKVVDETGRSDITLRKINNRFEIVGLGLRGYEPVEVNEDFASSVRSLLSKGTNVVPQIWRKLRNLGRTVSMVLSGKTKGRRINKEAINNLYNCRPEDVPPKSSNAEKQKLGVTWAKRLTRWELEIMNETDPESCCTPVRGDVNNMSNIPIKNATERTYMCGFFKALVIMSVKFGPASNNLLFDKLNNINK